MRGERPGWLFLLFWTDQLFRKLFNGKSIHDTNGDKMVLVGGVDIPLIEVILVFGVVVFILLVESIVIISLLVRQLQKTKNMGMLLERLSQVLLEIKKAEIDELDKLRRK